MQLTTKGRYAITAMLDLATNTSGRPVTLEVISDRQNISLLAHAESGKQIDMYGSLGGII